MCVVLLSVPYEQCLYLTNSAFNLCVYAIRQCRTNISLSIALASIQHQVKMDI